MGTVEVAAVWQPPTHQAIFRRLLDATARPGTIADLHLLLGGAEACLGVLATLCDHSQRLADPTGRLGEVERRFLRAQPSAPEAAGYILADGGVDPGPLAPCLGTLEAPELGATIVLRVECLSQGAPLTLSGPGIAGTRELAVVGLHPGWLAARERWCAHFPRGCDLVLADAERVTVVPRTTLIAKGESWPM
jgi:alpha-D-ribose 1-methylphosphonate 5-triphosphate synthase subunit PhnH